MQDWPHQVFGAQEALARRAAGCKRLCITSPTGGGKSHIIRKIAQAVLAEGHQVALYSSRILMIEQLTAGLTEAGIFHGVRAAGYEDEREHPFQVCSFQTETSRVLKRQNMQLHACNPGDLAIIDEGHLHVQGAKAKAIREMHVAGGAMTLDVTATPLGMSPVCDELIVAGTTSELRKCGALVPAVHFGCDEPDLKAFKKLRAGQDLSENQNRKAMMTPGIMGRVWKWYEQLNPHRKPCLLFGPGVEESLWFAQQFTAKGVRSCHIDGDDIWIDGTFRKSSPDLRREIREASQSGRIEVVCNRYVLREGIDWPWIEHLILAFVAGSLQTYLQIGGRGLRAYPGKTECRIQDHGGGYWRHGSLNEDREWRLPYTADIAYGLREDRLRDKKCKKCRTTLKNGEPKCAKCGFVNDGEPVLCPNCGRVMLASSKRCSPALGGCGYQVPERGPLRSRAVVSTDGEVRRLCGDKFRPHRIFAQANGPEIWKRMYYRSKTEKGDRTFRAAMALFAHENNFGWPDRNWPLMPIEPLDFFQHVSAVPMERLK